MRLVPFGPVQLAAAKLRYVKFSLVPQLVLIVYTVHCEYIKILESIKIA